MKKLALESCCDWTCGWTHCDNRCNRCDSFCTDRPELC
jgi:hypothetical protein